MTHPNDMSTWDVIACQRDHLHVHVVERVHIGGPHGFKDLAAVPRRFQRDLTMALWDPNVHPVDDGPYCPAHDAVSETIVACRVWEPGESTLVLSACSAQPGSLMIDFGAQIGWFSLLAASCDCNVLAVEADADNLKLLRLSAEANGFSELIQPVHQRVDATSEVVDLPGRICVAKLDIEGAETHALRMLWPYIERGNVDHLLIEITPSFADYYPDLVCEVVDAGYRAYLLPPKNRPPHPLESLPGDLQTWRIDQHPDLRALVSSWHQESVWFARPEAPWG